MCIEALWDHRPFEANSQKGVNTAIAKKIVITAIVLAALAVGVYFLSRWGWTLANPFQWSETAQIAASITGSSISFVSLMGLGTWLICASGKKKREIATS